MRKGLVLMFALVLVVSGLALASVVPDQKTVIAGKIYDSPNFETANPVANANINVTCNGITLTTISQNDGTYSASFVITGGIGDLCPNNATVTVVAEKNGITNSGTGVVHDYTAIVPDLYIGVVNIALVPEFSLIIGTLTILSAVGVFFVIRRK